MPKGGKRTHARRAAANEFDVIVVGAGPAGLTAALYCARANLRTLVLHDPAGSNLQRVPRIANLFGFPDGVTGLELLELGQHHAEKYGAVVRGEEVVKCVEREMLRPGDPMLRAVAKTRFLVRTAVATYGSAAVVVAAGIQIRSAGIKNEFAFFGKGVGVCVACDGPFFKRRKIVVVGGGNLAASEALDLQAYTDDVRVNVNGGETTMSDDWRSKLERAGVEIVDKRIAGAHGRKWLEEVEYMDGSREPMGGLFLAMGTASAVDFARSLGLEMAGQSLKVDRQGRTNLDGVWAAGDVIGPPRQIGKSVGDGVRAAIDLIEWVRGGTYVDHRED